MCEVKNTLFVEFEMYWFINLLI